MCSGGLKARLLDHRKHVGDLYPEAGVFAEAGGGAAGGAVAR